MSFSPPRIPVSEIRENGKEPHCENCSAIFRGDEDACFEGAALFCETCAVERVEKMEREAIAYAEKSCRLKSELPRFDPATEFRCTPDEYENGQKESNTRNSHLSKCRHGRTNYDELIKHLDRHSESWWNHILYGAIREQIDSLLQHQIEQDGDVEEEDDFDDPDDEVTSN